MLQKLDGWGMTSSLPRKTPHTLNDECISERFLQHIYEISLSKQPEVTFYVVLRQALVTIWSYFSFNIMVA